MGVAQHLLHFGPGTPDAGDPFALDAAGNIYFLRYGADNGTFVSSSGTYSDAAVGAGYRAYFGKLSPVLLPSTTSLAIGPSPAYAGNPINFTAVVTSLVQTTPVPTGTVLFTNTLTSPAIQLGTATLSDTATATFSAISLPAGTYGATATYSGDTDFDSNATAVQWLTVVTAPATTPTATTLTLSSLNLTSGASVTLKSNTVGTSGRAAPTDTVTFLDGKGRDGKGRDGKGRDGTGRNYILRYWHAQRLRCRNLHHDVAGSRLAKHPIQRPGRQQQCVIDLERSHRSSNRVGARLWTHSLLLLVARQELQTSIHDAALFPGHAPSSCLGAKLRNHKDFASHGTQILGLFCIASAKYDQELCPSRAPGFAAGFRAFHCHCGPFQGWVTPLSLRLLPLALARRRSACRYLPRTA